MLIKNETILKSKQKFKKETHNVSTEEINKIALNSNDDMRLQTFNKITSCSYCASVGKVCKTGLSGKYKWLILKIIPMKIKRNTI